MVNTIQRTATGRVRSNKAASAILPELEVRASIKLINAELAKTLLERSKGVVKNRRISQTKVSQYRDMMLNGQWKLNGETLILNKEGYVIDGQHRLKAVIEAAVVQPDIQIPLLVTEGVEDSAMATIDQGLSRTIGHAADLSGRDAKSNHLAITKALYFSVSDAKPGAGIRTLNTADILETYDKYRDAIRFAAQSFSAGHSSVRYASYKATIARAYILGYDQTMLERFMQIADRGIYDSETELAAVHFRNYVVARRHYHNLGTSQDFYRRALWAIDRFLKQKPVKALGSASEQLFYVEDFDINLKKPLNKVV